MAILEYEMKEKEDFELSYTDSFIESLPGHFLESLEKRNNTASMGEMGA